MYFIYDFVVHLSWFFLKLVALFNPKIKLFVSGRKHVFSSLEKTISKSDDVIWIHVASLGEFEQGLPIIEQLKKEYPLHKVLVTFFSPSGYEVKKDASVADIVVYLPMDTKKNAERFLSLAHPKIVIFVKYEIWPNYLRCLQKKQIPVLLVSAIFKKNQIYFRGYGKFMRKTLSAFSHFFVQDENSMKLLSTINLKNVSISGDTRFDRVSEILKRDNNLSFMNEFKGDHICFVAGSTWPQDESILVDFINSSNNSIKYVLAPHNIKSEHSIALKKSISKNVVLYSEIEDKNLDEFDVIIVDVIGLLTKIYCYADIAYVGGGFATGLHNTLEPATFGIPVIIGPNYEGFKEAEDLVDKGGVIVIESQNDFTSTTNRLLSDSDFMERTGGINQNYVADNKGASIQIMTYIRKLL